MSPYGLLERKSKFHGNIATYGSDQRGAVLPGNAFYSVFLSDNLNAIKPFNKIMILSLWANHKLGPLFKDRKVKTSKVLFFWGVSYQTIVMIRQEGFMLTICMLFAK